MTVNPSCFLMPEVEFNVISKTFWKERSQPFVKNDEVIIEPKPKAKPKTEPHVKEVYSPHISINEAANVDDEAASYQNTTYEEVKLDKLTVVA